MKTNLTARLSSFFIIATTILVSCSKNDNLMNPYVPPVATSTPTSIGAITDSGSVSPGLRVMKMDINAQNFTLSTPDQEVTYPAAKVKAAFYVNNDGLIPSGDYSFSNADSKSPFTFDSATLLYNTGGNASNSQSDQIVDGTINVTRQGNIYVFSLKFNFASGMTAAQTYSGVLDYADSE